MPKEYFPFENRKEHDLIRGATVLLSRQYTTVKRAKILIDEAEKDINQLKELFNTYASTATTRVRKKDKDEIQS